MSISYNLAPNPKWYISDLSGRPLGGGYMATFRSLNPSQIKLVYQDQAGNFPWPYVTIPNVGSLGILFDENGSQGPFYWAFDTANPQETYYLEVYDSDGVLQWTIDNFTPPSGSGGSIITTAVDLENIVVNNVMYRNTGSTPISTSQVLRLAPGAHSGLATTSSNANPDIYFLKNNLNATDNISFPRFTLGDTSFAPDTTPYDYFQYECTNSPASETQKCVQFPITKNVQNLSNQQVTVTIWARYLSGTGTITLLFRQFFGNGGSPSADVLTTVQTFTLSNIWQKFSITTTIPSVTGKTLGSCANDALFLQVQMPLGVPTKINFTKPSVYIGDLSPSSDYHTYDMIDAIINAPRTGYVFGSYDLVAPPGYIALDDGSIGSSGSVATQKGTDVFPLYNWLWTNVSQPSSNANCPVSGGLGANAVSDFTANKTLTLPRALGRVFSGSGTGSGLTAHALGQFGGEEAHTQTIAEMPAHNHPGSTVGAEDQAGGTPFVRSGPAQDHTIALNIASQGGGTPFNVIQPTSYLNYFIKL